MKKLKKGFTLVELVIVIAVIAVLAAVLIPTFSGIVNRAKVTSDIETATALNTLATGTNSIEEFVDAVEAEDNLSVKSLIPQVSGNKFVWAYKGTSAQVLYVDNKFNPIADKDKEYDFTGAELWTVVLKADHIIKNPKNAINYFLGQDSNQNFTLTTLSGFKTGDNTLSGKLTISDLTSTNEAVISGNFTGTVEINAPNADIVQSGSIKNLNVTAVANNSLDLNGYVEKLAVNQGKVDVNTTGYVGELTIKNQDAKVVNAGIVEDLKADAGVTLALTTNFENAGGTVITNNTTLNTANLQTSGYALNIGSREQLEMFRDAVNGGATYNDLVVNLTSDITLKDGWTPIGNFTRNLDNGYSAGFMGVFNGGNHIISNLNNIGYDAKVLFTNKSTISGKQEFSYGLFARVEGATITNLKLQNVKIEIPTDSSVYGDSVGAVVGFAKGVTLSNITVGTASDQSKVSAYDGVGGILGRNYQANVNMTDCVNYASVSAGEKAGGVAGYIASGTYTATFTNCENYGVVTVVAQGMANKVGYAGGIAGWIKYEAGKSVVTAVFQDCVSDGNVNLSIADGVTLDQTQYLADKVAVAHDAITTENGISGNAQVTKA